MKYIAFFDSNQNSTQNRYYALAATNKISYICEAMGKQGIPVEIISPAWTKHTVGYYPGRCYELDDTTQVRLFASFGASGRALKKLRYYFSMLQFFFYLLFHVEQGERVMVYHSVTLIPWINALRRLKKIYLILEVEEIYGDVSNRSRITQRELTYFKTANGYLFPTELLHEKVNVTHKPYIIIYGTYAVELDRNYKWNDGKIHCVYAGTFAPQKGGALAAAAAAAHLDSNYHIHIIGFGSEADTENLKKEIAALSQATKCTLSYDGLLSGEEYLQFLQRCDIGLSTQNPNAAFNETSFPSKVLSYLANGLRVVSIRIKVLERSVIHPLLYYYEEDTPQAIAAAIRSVPIMANYDSRIQVSTLDNKFCADIKELILDDNNHD